MITRSSRIAIMFAAFTAAVAAAPLSAALADAPMIFAAGITNGSDDFVQQSITGVAAYDTYRGAARGPQRTTENLDIDNASHNRGW
ncbi:MAG TPA: hypothetical protein VGP48_12440 [Stellaceae bacterium]|jgi:hypothetical protein|nr:hypothetical protein [Stellaceae bacterium]